MNWANASVVFKSLGSDSEAFKKVSQLHSGLNRSRLNRSGLKRVYVSHCVCWLLGSGYSEAKSTRGPVLWWTCCWSGGDLSDVCAVVTTGWTSNEYCLYLMFEYMPGGSVAKALKDGHSFSFNQKLKVVLREISTLGIA